MYIMDEKWLCGLNFARSLNFTDNQYEEAVKRIDSPDDANQLVTALISISGGASGSSKLVSQQANSCADETSQLTAPTIDTNPVTGHQRRVGMTFVDDRTGMTALDGAYTQYSDTQSCSSASSSGYSSFIRVPSSNCQSSESLRDSNTRRNIYIDGPNVARTHGKDLTFSWLGIKLSVDWFASRHHKVKVFVPEDRCKTADTQVLDFLENHNALIKTPSGCNDDLFIIEAAKQNNGIIVSNDLYRDEAKCDVDLKLYVHLNRLPYIFVDDSFMPAKDPRGRAGPRLEDFLRHQNHAGQNQVADQQFHRLPRSRLHPSRSYQKPRYQSVYGKQNNYVHQRTPIGKATMSLPVEAKTALYQSKSHDL